MLESCANLQSLFNTAYRKAFFNILCNIALLADLWSLFYLVSKYCYLMLTNEGRTKALLFCFFPLLGNEKTVSKPSALPNQNFKMLWAIATHNHKAAERPKRWWGFSF